ncbi:MAG: hypothetical protein ACFFB2_02935 [Promethearchaeota archaeon]
MIKRNFIILIAIFLVGAFSLGMSPTNLTNISSNFANKDQRIQTSSPTVATKIMQDDPRGHLTGRIFYNGLNDIEPDGDFDILMINVEVEITSTYVTDYIVMAALYDQTFQRRFTDPYTNDRYYDGGYFFWGKSNFQTLSNGIHNITVHFNCTQLRALKLAGPYRISHVQLANGSTQYNYEIFDENWSYNPDENPLLLIPQIFDIYTFDEPMEIGSFIMHDATLTSDYLEVNITFQSFFHWMNNDEPYYIRLVLRNSTGETIGHWEQTFWLQSNSLNEIKLTISRGILRAFDFYGDTNPTIYFEEVAIVELYHHEPFSPCNMSYAVAPYSTAIDISSISPIQVLGPGDEYNFGTLAVNDSELFGIVPQYFNDVLHLQVERTEPVDVGLPDFDIWYLDGFGRLRSIWDRDIIRWEEWMGNINTDHYLIQIGKYTSPWLFQVLHADYDQPPTATQDLTVRVDITEDTSPPSVSITTPTNGAHFGQYYGISITGTSIDESAILYYQILSGQEVLFTYNPYEWNWGEPASGPDFRFTWFPSHDLIGNIEITIRAYDMTYKTSETTISITIDPGTIPSPESTITKGLAWLRTQQNPDGSWDYQPGQEYGRPGMAALAALCFIQAGLAYDQVVEDAIGYLQNTFSFDQDDGRSIYHSTYETAMATTTLLAYNATLPGYDSALDSLIDDAIAWLVYTQNDETWSVDLSDPWYGGWRYGDDHQSSDLSVSQWAILTLSTYENFNPGGLDPFDPNLWDKVDIFVRRCRGGYDEEGIWRYDGGFTYTPSTEDWRDWGSSSYGSMTAAGIWGLYLSGSEPNDPDILSALDWINNSGQIVGGNPHSGRSFEYYWYLSASKAFLMAGRDSDQWWYDSITEYLNTHMIYVTSTRAYWENTMGGEPPVFATVQAILAQQVYYGHIPMDSLEVTLESVDGSAIYLWNSTMSVGYNYTTGFEEAYPGTTYSGLIPDSQNLTIHSPIKGEYFIDVFPVAGDAGISKPQVMVLRVRALTESGHIISYKTHIIDYSYPNNYPQVLRYKMVLTTISGIDIHFSFEGYETFTHAVEFDDINAPTYVDLNEEFDIIVRLTNIGIGTVPSGRIFAWTEAFVEQSQSFTNWAEVDQKTFTFHYNPSGLTAGVRTFVIGLIGDETTPLIIRVKVQIGNRAPEGTLENIDNVISGTEIITWTASDPDGDILTSTIILVKPDGTKITLKSGTTDTTYSFDSTAYPDDTGYRIIIEISDGTDTTSLQSDLFEINNIEETTATTPESKEGPEIGASGFELIFSILSLSLLLVWLRRKK